MNINIFDDITSETAAQVRDVLERHPTAPLTVRVNSYGGSPFAATAIYNTILGKARIFVEGIAASAATLVCCAGYCSAAENTLFMIHGAWTSNGGNAQQLRQSAEIMEKASDGMARIYAQKTHRSITEIRQLLNDGKDHWFTAQEALTWGLIDEITAPLAIKARLGSLQLPERLRTMNENTDVAAIEARAMAAERQRASDIRAKVALVTKGLPSARAELTALQDQMIANGIPVAEAIDRILWKIGEDSEPLGNGQGMLNTPMGHPRSFMSNPVPYGGRGVSEFVDAASDALAWRMGAKLKEIHPAARDFRETSLTGIAALALQACGINPTGMSADRLIQAAHSTSDFPVLLQESGNRTLTTRFEQMAADHRDFCTLGDVSNFKEQKAANISAFPGLSHKPEAGEITYGTVTEGAEPYKLGTYAKGFAMPRESLINDDLGAFASMIQVAANAGARLERDLVFGVLTSNPLMSDGKNLFHVDHYNVDDTHTTINVAGLGAARVLMKKQKDSSGGYVQMVPRFIICPVALETASESLVSSLTYRVDLLGDQQTPQWVKALRIIADPRLDTVDAGNWYLLSEPEAAPVIRLAFLNGQRSPTIEQDADFDRDMIKFKVRLDVAAAAIGFAGAVRMT